jgi:quinol monooxygenase YgiN
MVIVIAKLKAKSGEEEKVEKALRDVLPKVREEEGTLLYTLNRAQDDPSTFMVLEKYKDMDAFTYHSSTPYLQELFAVILPLLDGDAAVDLFEEIA